MGKIRKTTENVEIMPKLEMNDVIEREDKNPIKKMHECLELDNVPGKMAGHVEMVLQKPEMNDVPVSVPEEKEKHPLLMETILEHVLDFVHDRDLLNCRLVCKLWNKEAFRTMKSRQEVWINCNIGLEKLLVRLIRFPRSKVATLHIQGVSLNGPEFMSILNKIKWSLTDLRLEAVQITYENYCKMIRMVGSGLERLELGTVKDGINGYHRYFPLEDSDAHEENEPLIFPKMKFLEFISFNDDPRETTKLSRVVRMFPNLDTLIASNPPPEKPEKFLSLRLDNLTRLQLRCLPYTPIPPFVHSGGRRECFLREGGIRTDHLDSLRNMQLKLKSIGLFNIHPSVTNAGLREFFQEQKETLEHFELHNFDPGCVPSMSPAPIPFPTDLPNVKKGAINRPYIRNLTHVFNSLPKLEEVDFQFPADENCWGRILPARLPQFQNLKTLDLNWITSKHLTQLAKAFTGLQVFKIRSCDDNCLRVIFAEMKTLNHLIVIENHEDLTRKTTDEGFTGIPYKFLEPLSLLTDSPRAVDLSKLRIWPSIVDLKNLKTLALKGKNKLTYKTLVFGVAGMQNLHYVAMKIRQPRKGCMRSLSARGLHFGGNHHGLVCFARGNFMSTIMSSSFTGLGRHLFDFDMNPHKDREVDDGDED